MGIISTQAGMIPHGQFLRKSIHLLTGAGLLALTYLLERELLLGVIATGTVFSFATYNKRSFRALHKQSGNSLGTLFYPLGVLTAFLLLYRMPVHYFQICLAILVAGDTMAFLAGQLQPGNIRFHALREEKSLFGVLGFAITTFFILFALLPETEFGIPTYVILTIILAINFELISYRGSDNFSIPVGCALYFLIMEFHEGSLGFLIGVVLISLLGSALLYHYRVLSKTGSFATYILGIYFFGVLGISWSIPVLAFFFTSVVFTRIHTARRKKPPLADARNAWQVLANILWALVASAAYLISKHDGFILAYVALIAAVTADTWSSEIGPVFHKRCFSLADMGMRGAGISGGISAAGTLAAIAGALFIAVLSLQAFFGSTNMQLLGMLAASGFLASVADSFLGAYLEPGLQRLAVFKPAARNDTDRLTPNDVVNLLSSASAPVFFLLIRYLLVG